MKVAFLTRDPDTVASARVRIGQYLPSFRAAGVVVEVRGWDVHDRRSSVRYARDALRLARWADVIVLQKPRLSPRLLAVVARINPHLIVDFDDALWASRQADIDARFGERLLAAIARARVVVAGSDYLAGWARERCDAEVVVIPPSLDPERFAPSAPNADNGVTLGWIGSPANLADFTPEVIDALREVQRARDLRLAVISTQPLDAPGVRCDLIPWSLDGEAAALAEIDIGLMPLEDTERSRGRCSFKAVQYMAAGKPVVASPVGSASEVVVDGETGLLVSDQHGWCDALLRLADDASMRERLGRAGRDRVVDRYSLEANTPRWLAVLERVDRS